MLELEFFSSPFYFWFIFVYGFLICTACIAAIQCRFMIDFANITIKKRYYIFYALLLYTIGLLKILVFLSPAASYILELTAIYAFLFYITRTHVMAALNAMLTVTVVHAAVGITIPLSKITIEALMLQPDTMAFNVHCFLTPIVPLLLSHYAYRFILKNFHVRPTAKPLYLLIVFVPLLLNILALGIIVETGYQTTALEETPDSPPRVISVYNDYQVLLIFFTAAAGMPIAFIAFKKVAERVEVERQKICLEQYLDQQKIFLQEAQTKYAYTRSFRHDIKNHFLVINNLLSAGEINSAKEYLNRLEQTAAALSFAAQTGNIALDALLNNKLSLARQNGVRIECEVALSPKFNIDDVDLCVIFSNAIDNAAKACAQVEPKNKYIRLASARKGKFFMIVVENSQNSASPYPKGDGLGLRNIQAVADKYRGALSIESKQDYFCLNVLLVIS